MKLKGSQILLKMLEEEKVDMIFGYPGGAVLDIYDQLYKSKIKHILVRHEQGAVHAADGYARKGRRLFGNLRARRHEYSHRYCHC